MSKQSEWQPLLPWSNWFLVPIFLGLIVGVVILIEGVGSL